MGLRDDAAFSSEALDEHRRVIMTDSEEQQMIHAVAGLAQSVNALLTLLQEAGLKRAKTDEEILNLLKIISRKH
jgi:hypothetical protein